jgi:penicillin-binding protein 1A
MANSGHLLTSHRCDAGRTGSRSRLRLVGAAVSSRTTVVTAVAERRSRSRRLRRRRRQVLLWLVVGALVSTVTFAAGLLAAPVDYSFQPEPPQAVLLLDSHGRVFATIRSPQVEEPVASRDIPQVMKNAIVAAEDERFFEHRGVDPLAAVRALWRDVSGQSLQGGSTITQQYVKNVYTGDQRTALRKLREASLAVRLEQHLTKDEILTRYLNTLYLGNGTAGVQAASRFYFGVPVQDLDLDPSTGTRSASLALARAATLAGIAPAPSDWNPVHDPKAARKREIYVLNRMIKNRLISSQQASDAYGSGLPKIVAQSQPEAPTVAPEFRDLVQERLKKVFTVSYDNEMFASGGVKVRTTLDLDLQRAAVSALAEVLPRRSDPEAAIAAIDPRTGDVRALAEKKDGGYQKGGYDLATNIRRSSGSTIKPFTLAVALAHGHRLDEPAPAPECIRVAPGYRPCNAEHGSSSQTLRTALVQSINTVYAPLAVHVGLDKVVGLAQAAGMEVGSLNCYAAGKPCDSYALGIPVSPFSEAAAYGMFADHGIAHTPNSVLDVTSVDDGDVFANTKPGPGRRVLPRRIADAVSSAMADVVDHGTGTAARQPFPVIGKTGTTDNFTNAWFTGCSSTLCISIWMGYDKEFVHGRAHEMRNVEGTRGGIFGGTLPAEIFAKTFSNYRTLLAREAAPSASPTPTPSASVRSTLPRRFTPAPSASSPRPRPTPVPTTPPPSLPPSETPSPSPSASPSLLPTP